MTAITLKRWIFDKISAEAERYNTYIDISEYFNDYYVNKENDSVKAVGTVIKETEKAMQIHFESGKIGDGSTKGWTSWVPKSQIISL